MQKLKPPHTPEAKAVVGVVRVDVVVEGAPRDEGSARGNEARAGGESKSGGEAKPAQKNPAGKFDDMEDDIPF